MKAYPNLSTAIGGEEGGVCMGPAIVVMANGDGQCGCCCWDCCWCPVVSPLILSGGVNVPGIIPLPTSIRKDQNISTLKLHVYMVLLVGLNHFEGNINTYIYWDIRILHLSLANLQNKGSKITITILFLFPYYPLFLNKIFNLM